MKRTRVNPMSKKRRDENVERREAMITVRERDGHQCVGAMRRSDGETFLPGECHGPLNGHEIITRGNGGSVTDPANIVLVCNHHNEWCDLNHNEAITRGFRQLRFDPYSPRVAARLPHLSAPGHTASPMPSRSSDAPPPTEPQAGPEQSPSDLGAAQCDAACVRGDAAVRVEDISHPRLGRFDPYARYSTREDVA